MVNANISDLAGTITVDKSIHKFWERILLLLGNNESTETLLQYKL